MSKIIHVLGLGESLQYFKRSEELTIGVNDIYSKVETDYVVCIDHPSAFNESRLEWIQLTNSKGFYSYLFDWSHLPKFKKIEFNRGRGILDGLDSDRFCYSNSSPYVAAILAYKFGAKEIVLWGVDFKTHKHFKDRAKERALSDFKALSIEFKKRGVILSVGHHFSELSNFLPVFSGL